MKWIVFFLFTLSLLAFLVSGCGWFSDNPMFPRAKIMIVAEPIDSNSSENSTSGSSENSKNNVSVKIDLLPPDVEAYLKSNGIPAVLVSITFSGIDFATHTVSYQGGEFRFNVLENMLSNLSLEFYCSSEGSCASCFSSDAESNVNIACYLDAKSDVGLIRKVEFYINGEPAGIDTSPPFMSNTVSMNPEVPVLGIALVTDINGNVTTISKSVGKAENICSSSNSSSSSNS
ncbi:MAG: hypothetical protein PWP42_573, partial [Candidatus Atribacteria bacterium]|nr:hypothetical protein [Candidatus Atribacteria bacterium]